MTTVKRTLVAQAALDTSAVLNMRLHARLVGSQTPRRLMVTVPDGPSTDGGKKVRQSIVLAPANEPSAGTVMCGWLDIAQKRAELRVHEVVKSQYEARYRHDFDVGREEYDALLRDVKSMLETQGTEVVVIEAVPVGLEADSRATLASMPTPEPESAGLSAALYAGAFALLVLLAVGAYFVLR